MAQPSAPPSYGEATGEKDTLGHGYNQGPPYPSNPQAGFANPNFSTYPDAPVNQPVLGAAPTGASAQPPVGDDSAVGFTARGETFDDKNVRRLFVRKVFIVLAIQLLVTFGIVCIFTFIPSVGDFVQRNPGMYYAAYGIFITLYIMLVCCPTYRRKHPTNIILLMIFTLVFSYMVGTIASFYTTRSVVIALGTTVLVCGSIIAFSMQTKFDFTKCSGLLLVLLWVLILFGFITIFTYYRPWYLDVVYGALGALVFSLFLAFDTQLIMGGKRYELDPEEYVYGALNLYIDIVYIFLFLLSIFGSSN
uniref:Protein lifeguard 1 n=1 Tax=Phallusia mammillata TaxID=59560 RepID=A0A6F9DDC6_9ASCI|nr:protein lifeguard 1 [Phallusia mammillata]